jgi:hypothetical protein
MTATLVLALLGAKALWFTFAWLLSAIFASYLSGRKGYGEKVGLASGLILTVVGPIIWLLVPAKRDSVWKQFGPYGTNRKTA